MAHISAMYLAFVAAAIAVGTPPIIAAIGLGYTSTLSMSLTQYAGGPGPALYGSGYNSTGRMVGRELCCIYSFISYLVWCGWIMDETTWLVVVLLFLSFKKITAFVIKLRLFLCEFLTFM